LADTGTHKPSRSSKTRVVAGSSNSGSGRLDVLAASLDRSSLYVFFAPKGKRTSNGKKSPKPPRDNTDTDSAQTDESNEDDFDTQSKFETSTTAAGKLWAALLLARPCFLSCG
jgi:hypothetical protein